MKNKVKILYIHHGTGIGGAPISLINLIKHLDKDKFEIKVAFLKNGTHIKLFKDENIKTEIIDAPLFYFSHNETRRTKWYFLPYYFLVFFVWLYTAYYVAPNYLRKQNYNIIHLNSHVLTSWAYAAKKLNSKVILHNREAIAKGYFGIRRKILKNLISKNCDYVVNISQDNKLRLGIHYNSSVVYNFLEIPNQYRQSMAGNKPEKKILFLGGCALEKGFKVVLDCLEYLEDNIELEIAGAAIDSQCLSKIKNHPRIKLLGILTNPYYAIDQCDILITPFKMPHFSRPAIEAFAYGKPVIGSNIEGMNEIIDHNLNGLLLEKNDGISLARSINYLCNNPEVSKIMGINGRKKAIEVFSPNPNIKLMESIYNNVLNYK